MKNRVIKFTGRFKQLIVFGISLLMLLMMILFYPVDAVSEDQNATLPEGVPQSYHLVWSDEFEGNQLDENKWSYSRGSFDTAAKTQMQYTDSPANVSVSDGFLHLTARYSPKMQKWNSDTKSWETVERVNTRKENGEPITYSAPFTSGAIQTRDEKGNVKVAFKGDFYAEARIKLPSSKSSWSSFWMTGTKGGPSPGSGEIDVFESKGYDPSFLQANTHTPTLDSSKKSEQHPFLLPNNGDTQTAFHTYGVFKQADKVTFYYDGKAVYTLNYNDIQGENPLADEENGMILRLSQIVGGNFLKDKKVNHDYTDATRFSNQYEDSSHSEMLVDYVRVWQLTSQDGSIEESSNEGATTQESAVTKIGKSTPFYIGIVTLVFLIGGGLIFIFNKKSKK